MEGQQDDGPHLSIGLPNRFVVSGLRRMRATSVQAIRTQPEHSLCLRTHCLGQWWAA